MTIFEIAWGAFIDAKCNFSVKRKAWKDSEKYFLGISASVPNFGENFNEDLKDETSKTLQINTFD